MLLKMNSALSSVFHLTRQPRITTSRATLWLLTYCFLTLPSAAQSTGTASTANSASDTSGQGILGSALSQNRNDNSATFDSAEGGGSFADFQSLIDLIQTTVVPDTWEALGGPSTMAPYPQGVYVDPNGTLLDCQPVGENWSMDPILAASAQPPSSPDGRFPAAVRADWKAPSHLRFVSLRRLTSQWNLWQQAGRGPSEAMRNLAGLSQVQVVFLDHGDIVLAGQVNGIEQNNGWYRDRTTHKTTLQLDFFRVALWSSLRQQPFGCTIDPTREGLQAAAETGGKIQRGEIAIADASDALIEALGMQRVEVFGFPGETPIGYLMVEADRHMKRLALGEHPMPLGAINYLDAIDAAIENGPPQDLLLRLWFTAKQRQVLTDESRTYFELRGAPVRLSSENERAQLDGGRGAITRDPRTESFADSFNQHWHEICEAYPIYGAIGSVFEAASAAQLITRYGQTPDHRRVIETLISDVTQSLAILPTPRQVASIGTLHTVRHRSKRHHVLLASGGVMIDPSATIDEVIVNYPLNSKLGYKSPHPPRLEQSWWWDLEAAADQP